MTLPIDRTNKSALDVNLVNGNTSDAPKLKNNNDTVYNTIDELNTKVDTHSSAATLAHPDGSVTTAKIADSAITTVKVADLAITSGKIANGAVGVNQLAPGAQVNESVNNTLISAILNDGAIDVCNPPASTSLSAVRADGTDVLGDTNRLQAIVNYAIANKKDVYIPKDITLQPIAQTDGTLVCITFDDGLAGTGNDRKAFRMYAKKGTAISTNNTTQVHTIFRWKLGDSVLEGFRFNGTRAYTMGLEMSRINQGDKNEADTSSRNRFSDLRFYSCNIGISMEGSCYYNKFDNITFYLTNTCLWLKVTYAMMQGLTTFDSGVNRNNFYSISAFTCTDGVKLDYGDTNKFYSCSFEYCSGTAVQVNDMIPTYPSAQQTIYNTFYGVTNEQNGTNLVLNSDKGNSFIDFESPFAKVQFNKQPMIYIPSGDNQNNHLVMQANVQTVDQDVLTFQKNRSYSTSAYGTYVNNISDYTSTQDASGRYRTFGWRDFNFAAAQCTNVTSLIFNDLTKHAVWKSIGGIVFYYAKLSVVVTDVTLQIQLPLPELSPEGNIYGFNNNIPGAIAIGLRKSTNSTLLIPAYIDGANLTIPVPSGNWSSATDNSANVLLINLHYVRSFSGFIDTN